MEDKITTTIIPAAPGWLLGEILATGDEIQHIGSLDFRPIVAWEIERQEGEWHRFSGRDGQRITFQAFPICADGMSATRWNDGDDYVLRDPAGRWWAGDRGELHDEQEALHHLKTLAKERREAQAAE